MVEDQTGFLLSEADPGLRVEFTEHLLKVSGEIDMDGTNFEQALILAFEPGAPLTVDMSGVKFMDSAGIRMLLAARKQRDITILRPSERVRSVLETVGLAETFHLTR